LEEEKRVENLRVHVERREEKGRSIVLLKSKEEEKGGDS